MVWPPAAITKQHTPFPRINAEFDDLPLAASTIDLAIYNASIHYSTDYRRTLLEVRRCLTPGGAFLIVDSPVYRRREHGEMMRRERHQQFQAPVRLRLRRAAQHRILRRTNAR